MRRSAYGDIASADNANIDTNADNVIVNIDIDKRSKITRCVQWQRDVVCRRCGAPANALFLLLSNRRSIFFFQNSVFTTVCHQKHTHIHKHTHSTRRTASASVSSLCCTHMSQLDVNLRRCSTARRRSEVVQRCVATLQSIAHSLDHQRRLLRLRRRHRRHRRRRRRRRRRASNRRV